MEQATNLFNKGLQMDTHPMVLGNDSLTDCLNGTLITMNGNEVVLLNDMGNRRVDNAFLPAGYEPVGIKEYGGIIYVAAYNPITNRSLVGSFPSPERKIGPNDIKTLSGSLDFDLLKESVISSTLDIPCLKLDTILIPLTSDNVLHAGDKFVVYSDLSSLASSITNYNNTSSSKVASPKNKLYTLALGILNSQNEFVDITKTLCRWKGTTLLSYTNESDLYKFNDGYFIASSKPTGAKDAYIDPSDDRKCLLERLQMAVNTYAYKLIGPLYLKATLNHILDFNYNIYGEKNGNNADIYIEGYITYNCPDWINTEDVIDNGDDNYLNYGLGKVTNGWFKLLYGNNESKTPELVGSEVISYDPNTNLYTAKVIQKYSSVPAGNGGILKYKIGVYPNSSITNCYLENLSAKGTLDYSKLNSGEVNLIGWRFSNSENTSTITYEFEAYLKYGSHFGDLTILFNEVGGSSNVETISGKLYNGRVTVDVVWKNLLRRKLYEVVISGSQISDIGGDSTPIEFTRWLLTTNLMNECYNSNNKDFFIKDYGNPTGTTTEGEKKILLDKLKISLTADLKTVNNSFPEMSYFPTSGNWIKQYTNDSKIEVLYEHKYNISVNVTSEAGIVNEEKYPSLIQLSGLGSLLITPTLDSFDDSLVEIFKKASDEYLDLTNFVVTTNPAKSGNTVLGTIKFYDKFRSTGSTTGKITNPFGKVDDWLFYSIFKLTNNVPSNDLPKYGGIGLDYDSRNGGRDWHYVNIYYSNDDTVEMIRSDGAAPSSDFGSRIAEKKADDPVIFTQNDILDDIKETFNNTSKIPSSSLFLYIYLKSRSNAGDINNMSTSSKRQSSYSTNLINNARVWWRTSLGGWALFSPVKPKTTTLKDFIKTNIFRETNNLHYCFGNEIDCSVAKLSIPDESKYSYNKEYSLSSTLHILGSLSSLPNLTNLDSCKVVCKNGSNTTTTILFTKNNTAITNTEDIEIVLNSLNTFEDTVNNNITQSLSGRDIDTGLDVDKDNKPLDINSFYKLNNDGKLELYPLPKIKITSEYTANLGYRGILYNTLSKGAPNLRYDCVGDDNDDWTVVDYNNVNIVQ